MANPRQILKRRGAAANIYKVTATMETISAVRYRQYYNQWLQGLAFYDSLAQIGYLMASAEKNPEYPLFKTSDAKTNAIIVIGSQRGLCGAYNNDLYKQIDVHLKMAKRFGRELKIYAKGRKVLAWLERRGIAAAGVYGGFAEVPSPAQANEIADFFINEYLHGRLGRLGIVYNRFFSPSHQRVQTLAILPLEDLIDDLTTRAAVTWPWELNFEDFLLVPSAEDIFDTFARIMIRTAVSGCFLEAAVSECLARVVAMRNASENADEMIQDLTRQYNRARQGQITVELLDIISGVGTSR